jgi:predicted nucleotidyltransferase
VNEDALLRFDPLAALKVLNQHGVRYVLIGGFAGSLLGSPEITSDLDICYARDKTNLEGLAAALREMNARLRGVNDDVPFRLDARTLERGDTFTFVTDLSDFDILGTPSGTSGYDDLIETATTIELAGFAVSVASVDDLMRMKRAAGRAKDLAAMPVLEALKDEIENPPRHRRRIRKRPA